ncbi:MAG TPA: SDR family oxidoreductase, partial [Chthoniobacteraceae bacterium]
METLTRTSPDPRFSKPSPPFAEQKPIKPPGSEMEMSPRPDHGEDTYTGSGLLAGRAALITGADSGIGRAVALAFAAEGANVAISYLNESEDARESAEAVRARGRRALVLPGDIQEKAHCEKLIERTASEFGRFDILVNNAAYQIVTEEIDDLGLAEFERAFRTNVFATFLLSKYALRRMKPGSAIINTTSIQAFD